jgi:outer membrane lipoprotein-sorting protein
LTTLCLGLSRRRRLFTLCCLTFSLALLGVLTGCNRAAPTKTVVTPKSASEHLEELVRIYREAATYQDQAVVRLNYRRDGRVYQDEAPLSVAWSRPNRLHVRAYQAALVCDGETLIARINDPATNNFDGQVVQRPCPERLAVPDVYQDDQILNVAFRQGLVGYPPQMELLLSKAAIKELMSDDIEKTLLEPKEIDGVACRRIRAKTPDGSFVFWIDEKQGLLLRLEYPVAAFAPEIAADSSIQNVELLVEFQEASLGQSVDDSAFAFSMPEDAKKVRTFVPPPQELPSDMFGTKAGKYVFAKLDGGSVDQASLQDRLKVLVWFNDYPACRAVIQQLGQIYAQYRDRDDVEFMAVCVEPSTTSDAQVSQLLSQWQVEVPVVRDLEACGRDVFRIPWAPTTVILGRDDTVHIFEAGANPNLATELPQVLERLIAGEDLATEILEQNRQTRLAYQRALENGGPIEQDPDVLTVAPASDPQALQMKQLWTNTELSAPGNILAIDDASGSTRFLVYDGWRSVIELNAQGSIVARRILPLPKMAAVSQLRSHVDRNGQRFYLAWSLRDFQAHVFNASWERVLSYPPTTEKHDGVQDATLADVDGDGQIELVVGFWGSQGVHCVALDGTRRWANTESPNVFTVLARQSAAAPAQLWVAGAAGQPLSLNANGKSTGDKSLDQLRIHHLFQSRVGQDGSLCGVSYAADGNRLVVGLDPSLRSTWRYELPAGSFPTQVSFITSAEILADGEDHWLVAGPDGSVHVISNDGRFTDTFHTGEALRGLAGGRDANSGILIVSTHTGICAWRVVPPATARNRRNTK